MGDDFLLGVEPPLPQVQGSPVRLASASSSPSVKMKVWKEKRALVQAAPCPRPGRPPQGSGNAASGAPAPHPAQAPCAQSGPRAQPEWKQGWGFCRPHPPCRQLGPRSPGSCAGTSQVGRPAHPPGNRLQARPAHLAGHTPLLTQPGGGQRAVGGQALEVGFGKPSLNQQRTKACAGRPPSPSGQRAGGRMNHQALSASFVPGRGRGAPGRP